MYDLNAWLEKLQLKKRSSDYVGPCPACGGEDRFHVRQGATQAIVGCRGCIDGRGAAESRAAFLRIVNIVFGDRRPEPVQVDREKERREIERKHMANIWCAQVARDMISKAAMREHSYLADKGFPKHKWLVLESYEMTANPYVDYSYRPKPFIADELLVIPIRDKNGNLQSVQTIDAEGKKKFLSGGQVGGGSFSLGERGGKRCVVEGYATALSVRQALNVIFPRNNQVVVGFSAANIPNLVRRRDRVLADNDPNGIGKKYAEQSKCKWTVPPEVGMDANDYHQQNGLEALVQLVRTLI